MQKHTHIYICQRDQEQREGLHRRAVRKHLNELDNHYGAVSYPELDILEFEVKWALGSTAVNKASGCDGIPVELFESLKYDKSVAFSMSANLEDPAVATGLEKVNPHLNPQEGQY